MASSGVYWGNSEKFSRAQHAQTADGPPPDAGEQTAAADFACSSLLNHLIHCSCNICWEGRADSAYSKIGYVDVVVCLIRLCWWGKRWLRGAEIFSRSSTFCLHSVRTFCSESFSGAMKRKLGDDVCLWFELSRWFWQFREDVRPARYKLLERSLPTVANRNRRGGGMSIFQVLTLSIFAISYLDWILASFRPHIE